MNVPDRSATILLLSTADTELLAARSADAGYRVASPTRLGAARPGEGFAPPRPMPAYGVHGDHRRADPGQPTVAVTFYRAHALSGNTGFMKWGWVDVDEVVATLRDRPGQQHVVVTGRDADPRLVAAADLVVEMRKVKHPMDAGQRGQRGIEW